MDRTQNWFQRCKPLLARAIYETRTLSICGIVMFETLNRVSSSGVTELHTYHHTSIREDQRALFAWPNHITIDPHRAALAKAAATRTSHCVNPHKTTFRTCMPAERWGIVKKVSTSPKYILDLRIGRFILHTYFYDSPQQAQIKPVPPRHAYQYRF